LDKRILAVGVVLIIIALILGGVQKFVMNIYGSSDNKWYFWVLVGLIGLIGIILAAWSYMRKPKPKAKTQTQAQTQ
jgi:Na+/melibiose symporter-like transporter